MVSIRTLTVRHTAIYSLILAVLIIFSRWLWSYPQELNLAIEHQQRDVISIQNAIRSTHDGLTSMAYDYAYWNIVQDFLALPVLERTSPSTKALLQLSEHDIFYLAIINAAGEVPLALYRKHNSNDIVDFTRQQRKNLTSLFYPALLSEAELQTFSLFDDHSLMTAAVPIFTDEKPQQPSGWIVISWSLYGKNLNKLSHILQVNITNEASILQQEIDSGATMPYPDLYAAPSMMALPYRIRCLYSLNQALAGCMKIHHQLGLIPKFITFRIISTILIFSFIPFISFTIVLRFFIRPIEKATLFLHHAIESNSLIKIQHKTGITELEQARIAFNELIDTIKKQQLELERQSTTDPLTQIPNRRALDIEIEKTWNRINRHSGNVALILVDIDYFKFYNDYYGHQQGDIALVKVAQALQLFSRRSDDIAARYGGEEFVILFQYNQRQEIENLLQVINKTMEALQEPHAQSEFKYLTLSCGACWIESDIEGLSNSTLSDWIKSADQALYHAKNNGRNQHKIIPFNK